MEGNGWDKRAGAAKHFPRFPPVIEGLWDNANQKEAEPTET